MYKLPSQQHLIDRVFDRIKQELPDIDDPFWNDRKNVERHLTEIMKKWFRYEVGQTDFLHDEETGDVIVTISRPVLRIRWDLILGEDKDD